MKERLQEYALIAEIISAVAVVAGLIFVGLQIQQSTEQNALNTRAMEVAAYQDLIGQILSINTNAMMDEALSASIVRLVQGDATAAMGDPRMYVMIQSLGRHADMACFQHQRGLIDDERLTSSTAIYRAMVLRPLGTGHPLVRAHFLTSPGLEACMAITENVFPLNPPPSP